MTSGSQLRAEREALDVLAKDTADRIGKDPSSVCRLEQRAVVNPATAARYRQAIKELAEERAVRHSEKRRMVAGTLVRLAVGLLEDHS
jgi:hypothetical protein